MSRAERLVAYLADIADAHRGDIRTLYTSQIFISESMETLTGTVQKLSGTVGELTKAQQLTDERLSEVTGKLDALIDLMDRHLKEHADGKDRQ